MHGRDGLDPHALVGGGAAEVDAGAVVEHDLRLVETGGFAVQMSYLQVFIILLTLALMVAFSIMIAATPLGRSQRACEQDMTMAALLGINVDRTI